MALYQKYRPQSFSDVIGQDHISRTLLEAVKNQRLSHAYLLTGPRGTGKTTTARLLAKAINCPNSLIEDSSKKKQVGEPCNECELCQSIATGRALDVIEIDAASHTGVDDIRDMIEKAQLAPSSALKKVYIIDEVHMLSKSAFNALLKTLEEPPAHVVFILATTEIHKLPATIVSRVQRYDFHRPSREELIAKLKRVADSEGITISDKALELVAIAAHGGFRDAETLFEQVAGYTKEISEKDVENILGLAQNEAILRLLEAIFNTNAEEGLKIVHELYEEGIESSRLFSEVVEMLRKVALYTVTGSHLVDTAADEAKEIARLSQSLSEAEIKNLLRMFVENSSLQRETTTPLLPLEMSIVEAVGYLKRNRNPKAGSEVRDQNPGQPEKIEKRPEPSSKKPTKPEAPASPKPSEVKQEKAEEPKGTKVETKVAESPRMEEKPDDSEIVSAPVLEMTTDLWQQVVDSTKKNNTTLAALLRDAKPLSVSNGKITLGVKFKFHKDKISDTKNRQILEKILKEVTGSDYVVSCELADFLPPKKNSASDDELQQAAAEVFEIAN